MPARAQRLTVHVTPRAKSANVVIGADGVWRVRVTAPATDGRANDAVVAALAAYFDVPSRAVIIRQGQTSRRKLVEILSCTS